VDELLGRSVGPLTCVITQVHRAAAAAVRCVDVTMNSVKFSLVELTLL